MFDADLFKGGLNNCADQMVILLKDGVFDLELVVQVAHGEFGAVLHVNFLTPTSRARERPARIASYSAWLFDVLKAK